MSIHYLEDERMVSYVPLLVLSEEVFHSPLALWERVRVRELF
jgi:hypothetical protein